MGLEPEILGPPRFYWGEWRYPARSVIDVLGGQNGSRIRLCD
jgi:hypothetical protein